LFGLGGAGGLLHLLGWGLFAYYSRCNPALADLGTLAYAFGLRHAFDADHIAAIDNTTRRFLQMESGRSVWGSSSHSATRDSTQGGDR
jgi:high-affinity nickel-transport protein